MKIVLLFVSWMVHVAWVINFLANISFKKQWYRCKSWSSVWLPCLVDKTAQLCDSQVKIYSSTLWFSCQDILTNSMIFSFLCVGHIPWSWMQHVDWLWIHMFFWTFSFHQTYSFCIIHFLNCIILIDNMLWFLFPLTRISNWTVWKHRLWEMKKYIKCNY